MSEGDDHLARVHSLQHGPSNQWAAMAQVALDHGLAARDTAMATVNAGGFYQGPESEHLQTQLGECARLAEQAAGALREVLAHITAWLRAELDRAKREERREAVHGERWPGERW